MKLTTEIIKAQISQDKSIPEKSLKRISKKKVGDKIVREFSVSGSTDVYEVISDSSDSSIISISLKGGATPTITSTPKLKKITNLDVQKEISVLDSVSVVDLRIDYKVDHDGEVRYGVTDITTISIKPPYKKVTNSGSFSMIEEYGPEEISTSYEVYLNEDETKFVHIIKFPVASSSEIELMKDIPYFDEKKKKMASHGDKFLFIISDKMTPGSTDIYVALTTPRCFKKHKDGAIWGEVLTEKEERMMWEVTQSIDDSSNINIMQISEPSIFEIKPKGFTGPMPSKKDVYDTLISFGFTYSPDLAKKCNAAGDEFCELESWIEDPSTIK